jgi:hypothetical protein
VLFAALIAVAGFLLGLRAGLSIGYRAERGRRVIAERRWLADLARALDVKQVKTGEQESVDAIRARMLTEARRRS